MFEIYSMLPPNALEFCTSPTRRTKTFHASRRQSYIIVQLHSSSMYACLLSFQMLTFSTPYSRPTLGQPMRDLPTASFAGWQTRSLSVCLARSVALLFISLCVFVFVC